MQYIIAKASFSYVSYFSSLSVREAYTIGRSLFISSCDNKIFLLQLPEASVVKINGLVKSGYCKTGFSHNFCFNVSNDSSCADVHSKRVSFFNKLVKGLTNFEKLGINLL